MYGEGQWPIRGVMLCAALLLLLSLARTYSGTSPGGSRLRTEADMHGYRSDIKGSCWCGADEYCLCTPSLAIDAIIEVISPDTGEASVLLVHRGDPPAGYAIPGGFVNVGESVEAATIREVREETNLVMERLEQFRVYSDPRRDKRRHTVSVVFRCSVKNLDGMRGGDDAKSLRLVPLRNVRSLDLAFDHKQILTEYISVFHPELNSIAL